MNIEEIRRISREYAKGDYVRRPSRNKKKRNCKETFAQWFARSLESPNGAGPPPQQAYEARPLTGPGIIHKQTDAYLRQDPDCDGKEPW